MEYVLQELTQFVKGTSYVIAAVAILGFVPYWLFLTGGKRRRSRPHE